MGCLNRNGSVTAIDNPVTEDVGSKRTVLIAVTFVPNGGEDRDNIINILEVRKEGDTLVATNAVGRSGDEARIVFQDDEPTSTEIFRDGWR